VNASLFSRSNFINCCVSASVRLGLMFSVFPGSISTGMLLEEMVEDV
jgi:hypothetical protein